MDFIQKYFQKELSIKLVLLIVFLSATARVAVELIFLDYSGYIIELGYFENYVRFYLENVYYFIILFLLLIVFVSSLIKESFKKVANFGVRLYPLIIIPPLIDTIIWKRTAGYTYGTIEHFFTNFLTLSWLSGDTSYGISFLVTLGVISISMYVYFKKRSLLFALFSAVFTSFIIMVLSTPDLIFGINGGDYGHDYFLPLYYIFPLIILVSSIYFSHSKKKFKSLLGNMRPVRSLMFVGAVSFGYFTIPTPEHGVIALNIRPYYLLFAAVIALLAWWFSVIINDIYDYEIDKISNAKRPLPQNILTKEEYLFIAVLLAFFALSVGAVLNLAVFVATFLFLILGIIYSAPPIRLRKTFLGNIVIGISLVLSFLIGIFTMWSWNGAILIHPKNITYAILLFIFGTILTLTKDIKDINSDSRFGIWNVYTLFGKNLGKKVVTGLSFIAFNIPIFFIRDFYVLFATVTISTMTCFLYYKKEDTRLIYAGGGLLLFFVFILLYYV